MRIFSVHKAILFCILALILAGWSKPLHRIFLVGDSISIQYGTYLEKYLQGNALFERKQDDGEAEKNLDVPTGANGGDSRMVLAYLRAKMRDPDFKPDYLLLNCGLHDIKRNPASNKIQVGEKEYRENLEAIIQLLMQRHIQLIWMQTTPVVDSIHNAKQRLFYRYAADVQAYNKIADEVCTKKQVPVIDLFSFTQQLGIEQFTDHVHYKETACALQAAYIAGFIRRYMVSPCD